MDYFNPVELLVIQCFDLVDGVLTHRYRPREFFDSVDACEEFNRVHEGKAVASGDVVGLCGIVFRRSSVVRIVERHQGGHERPGKEKARTDRRAFVEKVDWLD